MSSLLKDAVIRDLVWEAKKGRVYFGDSNGRVAVASLPKVYPSCIHVSSSHPFLSNRQP